MPYQRIKALVDRHSFHVVLHALCQVACDRGLTPIFCRLTKIYEDTNPALAAQIPLTKSTDTNPALRNADDPPAKGVDLDKLTDPERRRLRCFPAYQERFPEPAQRDLAARSFQKRAMGLPTKPAAVAPSGP